MKLTPCPSPNGTNHERLFLLRVQTRNPAGAYDAALSNDPDRGQLLLKLERLLAEHLSGEALEKAQHLLHEHLGGHDYDRAFDDEPDPFAKVRAFLREKGLSEDEVEEALALPRNALSGGSGGAMAKDRRQLANDARGFYRRFPEAQRIVNAGGGS
jgi:hypothetical protein